MSVIGFVRLVAAGSVKNLSAATCTAQAVHSLVRTIALIVYRKRQSEKINKCKNHSEYYQYVACTYSGDSPNYPASIVPAWAMSARRWIVP